MAMKARRAGRRREGGRPFRVRVWRCSTGFHVALLFWVCSLVPGCGGRVWRSLEALPASHAAQLLEAQAGAGFEPGSRQLVFHWEAREADLRIRGRGVVRMEPPIRLRIDLFTPGGETLFQGALVDGDLRIPPWAPRELAPPPALLWAALGVIRPAEDWILMGGERGRGESFMFRFHLGGDREVRFWLDGGRLRRVEERVRGWVEEEVELRWNASWQAPRRTVYRNRREFRELVFNLESERAVDAFPADIWYPGW